MARWSVSMIRKRAEQFGAKSGNLQGGYGREGGTSADAADLARNGNLTLRISKEKPHLRDTVRTRKPKLKSADWYSPYIYLTVSWYLARSERFELPTLRFEVLCCE
jgi:hypothetical protein